MTDVSTDTTLGPGATEKLKQMFQKMAVTVVASLIAGAVGAALSTWLTVHLLDSRVTALETLPDKVERLEKLETRIPPLEAMMNRHEQSLERDFARYEHIVLSLSGKTDDQEKRLTRLETLVGETQNLLSEIRADVKILLRGGQQ